MSIDNMNATIESTQTPSRILKLKVQPQVSTLTETTINKPVQLKLKIQPQTHNNTTSEEVKCKDVVNNPVQLKLNIQPPIKKKTVDQNATPPVQKLPPLSPLTLSPQREFKILNSYIMFNGEIKNVEELEIGDELMGADSEPCTILSIQKVKEKAYLLAPTKGDPFIVGESEILPLSYSMSPTVLWCQDKIGYEVSFFDPSSKKKTNRRFSVKAFETQEKAFAAADNFRKEKEENSDYENRFEIFVNEYFKIDIGNAQAYKIYRSELDFPHKEFDIDPYIIGLWLADGTHSYSQITSADKEIIDYLDEYFTNLNLVRRTKGLKAITHNYTSGTKWGGARRNAFLNFLKDKNLILNKHIPMEMLLTSRENRLRLLAGILDGDGYLNIEGNGYDFVQKREDLFDQIIFLCRSLGFSCYKSPCFKVCTNAPGGPKPGNYFRCCISGEGIEEIPCVLARKQARERNKQKRVYVNSFILEDIGEREIYRIVTDGETYLMGDLTVRHRYEPSENNDSKKAIVSKLPQLYYLPYGYKNFENKIVVNEDEAIIIRLIFEKRYKDLSMQQIADSLNDSNYKPRNSLNFTHGIARAVLNNKDYYLGKKKDSYGNYYPKIVEDRYIKENKNLTVHYGYMKNKEGQIIINEKEAEVVRFIFIERKNNRIFNDIASILNSNSNYAKPRKAAAWTQGNIPSAVMKNKECYFGDVDGYPAIVDKTYA